MSSQDQVWCVSMFRDEEDVADRVLKHLIDEGVDGIIVADNMSEDETRSKILSVVPYAEKHGCRLIMEIDDDPGYYQSRKMTNLARRAAEEGADWIVPFDADEIWYARDRLAVELRNLPGFISVVRVPIINHFPTSIDPDDSDPFVSIEWRQAESQKLPKVAFRWHPEAVIEQGNHGVFIPGDVHASTDWGGFGLRHFPYRSFEHFKRKAINGKKAYEAAKDLPEDMGLHWRQYGQILEQHGEEALREVFTTYFWFLAPVNAGMLHDPAPYRRW